MTKIISVSRRTDIPAFYADWFMQRIKDGYAGHVNPYNGKPYLISLRPENVSCFVFWSKNYSPFIKYLPDLNKLGYNFYFNFTITGLPEKYELNLCPTQEAVHKKLLTP